MEELDDSECVYLLLYYVKKMMRHACPQAQKQLASPIVIPTAVTESGGSPVSPTPHIPIIPSQDSVFYLNIL